MALCADLDDLAAASQPLDDPLIDPLPHSHWDDSVALPSGTVPAWDGIAENPGPPLIDPLSTSVTPPVTNANAEIRPTSAAGVKRKRSERSDKSDRGAIPTTSASASTASASLPPKGRRQRVNDCFPAFPRVSRQRPKQYKRPTPSKFCHVCGRKSENIQVAVCSRIEQGMCRKVVCKCCFGKYGWDEDVLHDEAKRRKWSCPHCEGRCVSKAQCNTYGKTNYKRHLKLRRRRAGRDDGEEFDRRTLSP